MTQGKKTTSFLEPKKEGMLSGREYIIFFFLGVFPPAPCFFFFLSKFSFSFLPLDGSDGARATPRRLGQELIMNNKRVNTKEISDILILFTFLGDITYIASDSNRGKSL